MSLTVNEQDSKKELLKRTFCKGASDDEMELFSLICKRTGLSAEMKQIYPIPRDTKQPDGTWKKTFTFQTSIDGFRLIADRTGKYCPGKESSYQYDGNKRLISATSYVKKQTADGVWHEVSATAYYEEYVQRNKDGNATKFWNSMPHVMLGKCAEALALRKAFPAELSGLYTQDEMSQADNPVIDVKTQDVEAKKMPISEEQAAAIDMYLCQIKDEEYLKNLNNWLKVQTIYEMDSSKFPAVMKSLEKKINSLTLDVKNESDAMATVA